MAVDMNPSLRVLVVEDESLIRWCVREALAGAGHTVVEAADAESARRVLRDAASAIDVVLLDYRLPDSNDFRLLRDIRRLSPNSAVVMMTSDDARDLAPTALALGAHSVIDKPFDVHMLDTLLRNARAAPASAAA